MPSQAAYEAYGDALDYGRLMAANPDVPKTPYLADGQVLAVPPRPNPPAFLTGGVPWL